MLARSASAPALNPSSNHCLRRSSWSGTAIARSRSVFVMTSDSLLQAPNTDAIFVTARSFTLAISDQFPLSALEKAPGRVAQLGRRIAVRDQPGRSVVCGHASRFRALTRNPDERELRFR